MTHKTSGDKYDFEVVEKQYRPSKSNPEKVVLRIETSLPTGDGEQIFQTHKVFKPRHIESGRWKEHVKKWIDRVCEDCQKKTPEVETGLHNAEK